MAREILIADYLRAEADNFPLWIRDKLMVNPDKILSQIHLIHILGVKDGMKVWKAFWNWRHEQESKR